MQLKIGSKDVKLKFGMKFCRELDKVYRVDYQGLEFGMGVNLAFMNLNQSNPVALAEVVKAATAHEGYSTDDIDDAIERYAEKEGDLSTLFSKVQEEMGKSETVKHTLESFKKAAQEAPQE